MKLTLNIKKKNTVSPYLFMQFMEPLGTADTSVDACWDYAKDKWHDIFLQKFDELKPPMLRFGGCFASYYHWKEAVGPRSERKWMLNSSWDGVYSNQVGTKEVAELSKRVGAETLMVVNMESDGRMHWAYPKDGYDRTGTAEEAAEWIDYCNNPDNKLRISHGDKEPFGINYWQIGNETNYDKRGFNLEQTIERTLKFAEKMHAADDKIKLICWGDGNWETEMCKHIPSYVEYVSFHYHIGYYGDEKMTLNFMNYKNDKDETWDMMMQSYTKLDERLCQMKEKVAPFGKRLAMTEGHYVLKGRNRSELLSTWAAGVAYARCLNTFQRYSDILDIATMADFCGNRWQVNAIMMPTPVVASSKAYFQPVGTVMKLYSQHIGKYAIDCPALSGIDSVASVSEDGKKIFVHLVNTSKDFGKQVDVDIPDGNIKCITAYEIAPSDVFSEVYEYEPDIFNETKKVLTKNSYYLPSGAVSVLEIELE